LKGTVVPRRILFATADSVGRIRGPAWTVNVQSSVIQISTLQDGIQLIKGRLAITDGANPKKNLLITQFACILP
ncbi:MAG: hypothetical protein ABW220_02405, partial [Burkholderiaceae bacterium]